MIGSMGYNGLVSLKEEPMRFEKLTIAITIAAVVLAVPVAHGFKARASQLKIEKTNTQNLQLEIKSKQKLLEEKEQQNQDLQRQKQELEKQLQAKRESQARLAAQPAPAPAASVRPAGAGCEAYRPLLAQYAWNVSVAMDVMRRESGCNPNAVSPTNDHGLFQIHAEPIYDPAANVARAWQKYAARGWRPWYCCPEYW